MEGFFVRNLNLEPLRSFRFIEATLVQTVMKKLNFKSRTKHIGTS